MASNDEILHKKKLLIQQRSECLQLAHTMKTKADELTKKIEELDALIDQREIVISDHAFERFKQRVMTIPNKVIRQLLLYKGLVETYRKRGNGKYRVKDMPNVVMVITDFVVVTVVNTNDPIEKLKVLREYLNFYVDELVLRYTHPEENHHKIIKFQTFRYHFYKNQTGEK